MSDNTVEFEAETCRIFGACEFRAIRIPDDVPYGKYDVTMTPVEPEPEPFDPPWDEAPDWANWAARNRSCVERWYERRPKPNSHKCPWWPSWAGRRDLIRNWREGQEDPNWRDTLQKRPKPEPEPPSWDNAPKEANWRAQIPNGDWW